MALRVGARAVADRIERRVQAVKYELFPRAASVGKGYMPAAEDEEKSRKPYEQSAGALCGGLHYLTEPVAQGGGSGRETGGEASLIAGGAEYEVGVAPPLRFAGAQGHGLVAAELYVLRAAAYGQPDQRVEPEERRHAHQRQLGGRVAARDVYGLVREHQPELLVGIVPLGEHDNPRAGKETDSQRRPHLGRAIERRPVAAVRADLREYLIPERDFELFGVSQHSAAK